MLYLHKEVSDYSQQVLRTDVAGMPLEWIDYRDAVRLYYLADDYSVNLQMAASFIALLPPLLIAILLQRYMKVGLTLGGVKG